MTSAVRTYLRRHQCIFDVIRRICAVILVSRINKNLI